MSTNALTSKWSERNACLDQLNPLSRSANTYNGAYIDTINFHDFTALLDIGDIGAGGTVNFKLQQATSAAGAGVKDITGKAITQVNQTGSPATGGDNRQFQINLNASELDAENSFRWIRMVLVTATAASVCSAKLVGSTPRHGPASDWDATTVQEIV